MTTYHRLREKTCIAIAYTVPVYIEVYDGHHKIEDFSTPSQKKKKKHNILEDRLIIYLGIPNFMP